MRGRQGLWAGSQGPSARTVPASEPWSPGQSPGGEDRPAGPEPQAEMGNAALCPSCHTGRSARAQGHLQEADNAPDYYGCDSEDTLELRARVSAEPQGRRGAEAGVLPLRTLWSEPCTSRRKASKRSSGIRPPEPLSQGPAPLRGRPSRWAWPAPAVQ